MFPRMNLATPFQPVAYCAPQYGAGAAFGGISPIMNPYMCNPIAAALCGIGANPYASPYASGYGVSPYINPQVSPLLQSPLGQIGSPFQPVAWCPPSLVSSPVTCIDPVTGAVIPQQVSPYAHSLLPIRPLINPQACDPIQMAALCGVAPGQVTDPYSAALAQACMTPTLGVSPMHPALRPQVGVPQMALPCPPVVAVPGINC
jgi:hypothetical protein